MIFDLKRKQKFSEIHALPIKIQLQSRRKENNIKSIITLCQEFGSSKEMTIEKLIEQCHLTREQATEKFALYGDKK